MVDVEMMGGGMAVVMMLLAIFWVLFGLVLFALAVTALLWMVRALKRQNSSPPAASGPRVLDELDRRYASGELSRDEYLQYKSDMTSP
jgi:uncharacterized membrane protein